MSEQVNKKDLFDYVVALADDALVLGQRLSEWASNAPFLEEDIALANVALDFIGRAQMYYRYAVEIEDEGRTEDDLAYFRGAREYRNRLIFELPRGDFAQTMARQLIIDLYNVRQLECLADSADQRLAAIASKAIKESRYHLRRSHEWVIRLGDGTQESHERVQKAFNEIWGYTHELFQGDAAESALVAAGIAVDSAALRDGWAVEISAILEEATLQRPQEEWEVTGGRQGIHTEHLSLMLAEMQSLQRNYPGLQW